MSIWLRQHLTAFKSALAHLRAAPGNFLFNVLVVAIAMALPTAGLTLIENVRPVADQITIDPEISIFLRVDTERSAATALSIPIKKLLISQGITPKLNFIPKEKALAALEQSSNLAEVMVSLGGNPLPDAYVLTLSNEETNKIESLVKQLQTFAEVELVQVDSAWIKRLAALMRVLQLGLGFLAATLGVVVIVVVFNATRLQVISHQEEIAVARLLGATTSYLYKPYYYTGALLGLFASALALGIVMACLNPLNQVISEFARLYDSEFRLVPLDSLASTILLLTGMLLGLIGVSLSVGRQIKRAK